MAKSKCSRCPWGDQLRQPAATERLRAPTRTDERTFRMNVTDNQSLFIFISHWWYRGEAADPRPPEASRAFRDAQLSLQDLMGGCFSEEVSANRVPIF